MSKREQILAAAVLVLVAAWGTRWLYGRYERSMDTRRARLTAAKEELQLVKSAVRQGERAVRKMESWQKRSLPANREKAHSLYKAWLLAKAKEAGLAVDDIKVARPTPSMAFTTIGYQIEASGSLSSVAAMLYEFYRSPQLHQITRLRLIRPPGASQLQVSLESEALILPGTDATDKLPEGETKRLKLANVADYQKSLSERDLVTVYTPPRSPTAPRDAPPAPPKFDESELAFFSGAVNAGDGLQAWIHVRTTGETLHVSAGDPVKVGSLEGEIVSIEPRSLVLQTGEKKFRVALGQSLRKGTELDADGKPVPDATAEEPKS